MSRSLKIFKPLQKTFNLGYSGGCLKTDGFTGRKFVLRLHLSRHYATQMTMHDVKSVLDKWMDSTEGFSLEDPDRTPLLKLLPQSQDQLKPRSMKDSFTEAIIPLRSQPWLQQRYATVTGKLRMGRMLEDMDFLAVYIALKHIEIPTWNKEKPTPYVIVTASVDRIEFTPDKPPVSEDVRMSGQVVTVGRTSLDVRIILERKFGTGDWVQMTEAYFTMAARNATLTGPAFVNPLLPKGVEEEQLHKAAKLRKMKRSEADKASLLFTPPDLEEQRLVHELFMKSVDLSDVGLNRRLLPAGHVWVEDTVLSSCFFPHPENRNHHNTVFGGYIMRLAVQLAWMTAYKHSSQKPSLRYITNIIFKKSVSISQFMQIKSQVAFTKGNRMQIVIFIEMMDIQTKKVNTTHSLYVTYEVSNPVPNVIPKTYQESMIWLEGLREYNKMTL